MILTKTLTSQAETEAFAASLAPYFCAGDIVALEGGLGVGKTTIARALVRAILEEPQIEVPSPTFTLVQTYVAPAFEVWHADLYRLHDEEEVYELGFEDATSRSIFLIEWPEKLPGDWRLNALYIRLQDLPGNADARQVSLIGNDQWRERLGEFTNA